MQLGFSRRHAAVLAIACLLTACGRPGPSAQTVVETPANPQGTYTLGADSCDTPRTMTVTVTGDIRLALAASDKIPIEL